MDLPERPPGCPISNASSQLFGVVVLDNKFCHLRPDNLGEGPDEVVKDFLGPDLSASISFSPFLKVVRCFLAMRSRLLVNIVALLLGFGFCVRSLVTLQVITSKLTAPTIAYFAFLEVE